MREVELRLEDVGYDTRPDPILGTVADLGRHLAALKFFDEAFLRALGGTATCTPHGQEYADEGARAAFQLAQAATLLRFGVKVVGLEAEAAETTQKCPICLNDIPGAKYDGHRAHCYRDKGWSASRYAKGEDAEP